MRITIERLRTLVLALGALLVASLLGFLAVGHWKARLLLHELPKKLGADIKQEANEIVYTQSRAGHMIFKIRASKEIQLKKSGRVVLQNVQIELYGADGRTVDRITGNQFEYDQKEGRATATGPVEIAVSKPGEALRPEHPGEKPRSALGNMAKSVTAGEIDLKTDGLVFDQKSGKASTERRVEFETVQGNGNSVGAVFDSGAGTLVLDRDVQLNVRRGDHTVALHAQHAEFERGAMQCSLREAALQSKNASVKMGQALVGFRQDGSVVRVDGRDGVALDSGNGSRVNAATGQMRFDDENQPERGTLHGGVVIDSRTPERVIHGGAPTAELKFGAGQLRAVHLEGGVALRSEENSGGVAVARDWRSPMLDVSFRAAKDGKLALERLNGTGGVVVDTQPQQPGGKVLATRLSASTVNGEFSQRRQLTRLVGQGHAQLEQTTAGGMRQTANADQLDVHLAAEPRAGGKPAGGSPEAAIQSAILDGNVTFEQQPSGANAEPMHGRAAHAVYDGQSDTIQLTGAPRVDEGGLQIAAERIVVAQKTGQATAQGSVKATWMGSNSGGKSQNLVAFGGSSPAHVVADQAELQQASGQAVFRGHARLWQQASSVTAPLIVLNRTRQTLEAHSAGASQPVALILEGRGAQAAGAGQKGITPSVVRVESGDLKYSEAERKAILHAGAAGPVVANTGTATISSDAVEITLLPPGNHAGENGGSAQVDRMTARGNVSLTARGRHGAGEQLLYTSDTGDYVLTGTSGAPPRITDAAHGSVTGAALIFNTRDDSVRVEGDGHRTTTETTVPRR